MFYDSLATIVKENVIQHLNLEWMRLGNRAILLCEALCSNTSLYSVHLSNNRIDKKTLGDLKWYLSVGIDN